MARTRRRVPAHGFSPASSLRGRGAASQEARSAVRPGRKAGMLRVEALPMTWP
ncbi:hypothetical protein SAMN06272771_7575 [Streptomyces sp. Ag82_O1-12]|nr:hypothetical protein SAMN06272771_7575 [Streptomyces sp. Ag82_O1-12]SOD50069.1 hypothetical protein SAMN06272727_7582 [Streptomyces sp. Ag82_G6-1]